ncbi:AAA family ATPase [Paraburkholderia sp. CNPSo 3272]|uniref:ATP-dependent nuclease n=1 Tax=Paraburkholderia sp. CNPSo 3272 TaxID=2940931 RepID=UPI0020B7D0DB|nr:AAA family ATPase [Paraburkholderia sp. CNPSo 3272]MCP3722587.1 AAA family ATPase [Paraburkholderia sp. CNPSo 3272]
MYIRQLRIERFRGISSLKWTPNKGVNCLIGAGDSGKTTILDAIDLVFAERHVATFDDLDFYKGLSKKGLRIIAVLSDLPREFLSDDRYGLTLSGWHEKSGKWREEPNEAAGVIPVLTVALEVDSTLEPNWHVLTCRDGVVDKSKRMPFEDRKRLAPARLGVYADRHLSWGRGAALQRVGSHPEQLSATLNELARKARQAFEQEGAKDFKELIDTVGPEIAKLGVQFDVGPSANLDPSRIAMGAGGVALHDGDIPVRCMGTGSSRLAVAALQSTDSAERMFFLVDELEYGLEPHRASLLISHLRTKVKASGQVFLTTHSPLVLRELRFEEVSVCRRHRIDGILEVLSCNGATTAVKDARRFVRDRGEAFMAKTILVCEGQTEVGLLKGVSSTFPLDFQSLGVVFVDGGGDSTFEVAQYFARLGYRTAVFTDSDKSPPPAVSDALGKHGVLHFEWGDGRCTEVELFGGLPQMQREELLRLVLSDAGYHTAAGLGQLASALKASFADVDAVVPSLKDNELAKKIGLQANRHRWIKDHYDLCFLIGEEILPRALADGAGSCVATLQSVMAWLSRNA